MDPLLLLHGTIGSKDQLDPLRQLLESDFEVYAMNFSGHGGRPFASRFSVMQFAEEVRYFLDENNLPNCHLFGYDLGGFVALVTARLYPNRVRRIFTLATRLNWTPEDAEQAVAGLDPERIAEEDPERSDVLAARHAPNDWKELLDETMDMLYDLGDTDPLRPTILSGINHPVMMSIGDQDTIVPRSETVEASHNLSKGHLLILKNNPHELEDMDLQQLAHAIRGFLKN